jgi:ERCC4-type nuclease
MHQKLDNGRDIEVLVQSAIKVKTVNDVLIKMIASIPGIELQLARNLAEKFKSLKNLMKASEDDLMEVEKIGPKRAKTIKEYLV